MRNKIRERLLTTNRINIYEFGKSKERTVRKVISELRREGVIFIPIAPYVYANANTLSDEEVRQFMNAQIGHLRTQYFNTLKPLQNRVKDDQLKNFMGQLELALE